MEAISKTPVETKILNMVDRLLQSEGFRTIDVDCFEANRSLVRIFIERGDKSPTIDDCARVSQLLGPVFEVEEMFKGAYDLEISSPGLDRRLRLADDFQKAIGKKVQVRLHESIEGLGSKPKGVLLSAEGNQVKIDVSGSSYVINFEKIRRANIIWDAFENKGSKRPGKRQVI